MEPSPAVQRAAEAVAEAVARAGGSHGPRMHPFERMAARPCVVEAVEGSVEVEGNYLGTTIIDMGASQVLIGRRLAEHLGLHQEENVTPEGWDIGEGLEEGQKEELTGVLEKARDAFAYSLAELGKCNRTEMEIDLQSSEPVYQRRRRLSPGDRDIAIAKCKEVLAASLIQESTSEYAAATVVAVHKYLTGEMLARRMWEDYRGLNRMTKSDRVMDQVLQEVPRALCYIDDVVIYSQMGEQHVADVAATLVTIEVAGLTCHPEKCHLGVKTVAYLGFQVGEGGLSVQQAKVEVVDRLKAPTDCSTLRAQLGFLSYYRRFIPNFSKTAKPLSQLLRKDEGWKWWKEQERAWTTLKEAVKTAPLLKLPNPDEPFLLYTDWSSSGMCTVLCQEEKGTERVVAYVSRSCSPAESNYSSYEGEGLAAVWAVELFRPYLQGRKFTLVTDHQPLLWLMTNQTLKDRNARWAMHLQEFEFDVKHRPGERLCSMWMA
ncbi:hypothetical protein CLOM_g9013 [Closterium sp. NIES-68]|nr:hypothetical protein CLOM_g9013 [Closterium sp. NIES-68]